MSITLEQLTETLRGVLVDQILDPSIQFEGSTLLSPLGVDSMSYVRMLLQVERRHGVAFPDEEMTPENLATVDSLAAALFRIAQAS